MTYYGCRRLLAQCRAALRVAQKVDGRHRYSKADRAQAARDVEYYGQWISRLQDAYRKLAKRPGSPLKAKKVNSDL